LPINRQSNFELLRIMCIFGIICMHLFGEINNTLKDLTVFESLLINTFFNSSVSCFILLSGYFGIKKDFKKIIELDLLVVFYSVVSFLISITLFRETATVKELAKAIFPVISGKYWFISNYILLCFIAPYLNLVAEMFDRVLFRKLLITLLFLFSFIPTFFYFDIIGDGGKGIVHMTLMYLIGRYIRKYIDLKNINLRTIFSAFGISSICIFIPQFILSSMSSRMVLGGFFRDCSFFVIIQAVCVFIIFAHLNLSSKLVNRLAMNVLSMYLLDSFIRKCLNIIRPLNIWAQQGDLIALVLAYAVVVMISASIINELYKISVGKLNPYISNTIMKSISICLSKYTKFFRF
jgi:hypothetical protein